MGSIRTSIESAVEAVGGTGSDARQAVEVVRWALENYGRGEAAERLESTSRPTAASRLAARALRHMDGALDRGSRVRGGSAGPAVDGCVDPEYLTPDFIGTVVAVEAGVALVIPDGIADDVITDPSPMPGCDAWRIPVGWLVSA